MLYFKMIRCEFLRKISNVPRVVLFSVRDKSSSQIDIDKLEQQSMTIDVIDEDALLKEQELERKRNKSGLKNHDRNLLLEKNPYPEPNFWYHGTLKYNRRLYGRYGEASGVDPAICWPTKEELQGSIEYENIAYPDTIPDMIATTTKLRQEKNEKILMRQETILKKMEKLETWKQELSDRIAKKEAEALAAKQRKERLIEEVRRHFGYTVDPRDDKFKELLEKKEKEQKKMMKEARRKAKEEKLLAKLLTKKPEDKSVSSQEAANVKDKEADKDKSSDS